MTATWPIALALFASLSVGAATGDAEAGKRKANTCNACHSVAGFKEMPRLGGQSASYVTAALKAYETHVRQHRTMQDVARGLTARDTADLAAFYASLPRASNTAAAGESPAQARDCSACHGDLGDRAAAPDVPLLAGQSAGYLVLVLKEYRSGQRAHAVMQEQARTLTDLEIAELATWFGSLPGLVLK